MNYRVRRGLPGTDGAAGARAGLHADERLHAPERLGGLPPHDVAADERLELHQPAERLQCAPRLHTQ